MTALQFDLEKGFSIKTKVSYKLIEKLRLEIYSYFKIKVTSINEEGICNQTQPVTKLVKFFDSETRTVLVEVIIFLFYC